MFKRKDIPIDWNSEEECQRLINLARQSLSEIRKNKGQISRRQRTIRCFESCQNIYNTDISHLYSNLDLDSSPRYYVYAHCDPSMKIAVNKDGRSTFAATLGMSFRPFYIGKGTGNRAYELSRSESHKKIRQKIKSFGCDIEICIIRDSLNESEALQIESKLIDIFSPMSMGGHLVNLDEGIESENRRFLYKKELKNLNTFYRNLYSV